MKAHTWSRTGFLTCRKRNLRGRYGSRKCDSSSRSWHSPDLLGRSLIHSLGFAPVPSRPLRVLEYRRRGRYSSCCSSRSAVGRRRRIHHDGVPILRLTLTLRNLLSRWLSWWRGARRGVCCGDRSIPRNRRIVVRWPKGPRFWPVGRVADLGKAYLYIR